jgi:hypothetical protein
MADKPLDTYLNDHLGGATLGTDLAAQIRDRTEGTPLGDVMSRIADEIEEDRQTLVTLMDALGTSRNPVKEATAWVAEKTSRIKFSGATAGEPDVGLFLALESLTLGVRGKLAMWKALALIDAQEPLLQEVDLDELISRAEIQHDRLEAERLGLAADVFSATEPV